MRHFEANKFFHFAERRFYVEQTVTLPENVYSLRRVAGNLSIRVRRSSDNAELDVGFSGNDLDTASMLSFVGSDSGFVSVLYDQVGGVNFFQTVTGSQPRIVNAGTLDELNGKPCMVFDGVNDWLRCDAQLLFNPYSLSMVFSYTHEAVTGTLFSQWASGVNGRTIIATNQNSAGAASSGVINLFNNTLTPSLTPSVTTGQKILTHANDTSITGGFAYNINNSQTGSGTAGVLANLNSFIGTTNNTTLGNYLDGRLQECNVYKRYVDSTEEVERLNSYWNAY